MIGSVVKKFAEMNGMRYDSGFAYGKMNGRHISLEDGRETKTLKIYLYPPAESTPENELALSRAQEMLSDCDVKEYCLLKKNAVTAEAGRIVVQFRNAAKTMFCVKQYIDEILPRLDVLELNTDICGYCGAPIEDDGQYVLLDGYVLPVHAGCVQEMSQQMELIESVPKSGSVVRGAVGALLGALVGAVVYAAVFMLGYVAAIVGFITAWLSNWMYGKFGGKNSSARLAVVVVTVILGIFIGQVAGYTGMFAMSYESDGGFEQTGWTMEEYVLCNWDYYIYDDHRVVLGKDYDRFIHHIDESQLDQYVTRSQYIESAYDASYAEYHAEAQREFLSNIGMGLLFGVIGSFGFFRGLNRSTKRRSVKTLN